MNGFNSNELAWLTSALINDPIHVNDINTRWDRVGPTFMDMNYNTTEVNVARIRKIWNYYMGDRKLTWETGHDFSKLFGDRYLLECSLEEMWYHSMYTNQFVYTYHLSYRGRCSNVRQFGGKPEDWGVSHLDDLIYLLNNPDYYASLRPGDPELEMSHIFMSIWANFVTYDRPILMEVIHLRFGSLLSWRQIYFHLQDSLI